MGMPTGVSHDESNGCKATKTLRGNPNPWKFNLISSLKIGNFYLVELNYPDCTNFEGRKILVMDRDPSTMLRIDPHFTEKGYVFARFSPTKEGKRLAEMYLKAIEMRPV